MTEGIVDGGASESKAAFELAREAARKALPSPESRRALSAAKDFEEFETDVARGLQEGAAAVGLDGTGVPARPSETAGRAGKEGADPSGSPRAATREAKVVVFGVLGEGGAVVPARRSAAIDSAAARDTDAEPSAFARRLRTAAEASGFAAAKPRVVLGDGAKWIWNAAAEALPGCVEIVDLRHAQEHLREVGRALFGEGAALCAAWSREWCAALSEGRLDDVLAELRGRADCEAALRCAGHVEANRERMRHPEFRAMGLPVGSGVVESACGAVVADRLKRGGMRWTVAGANAMLALRCWILDRRLHDFQPAAARSPPLAAAA